MSLHTRREAPATSRPGWAQPCHCSGGGRTRPGPSAGRRWARVSQPHRPLLPRASPWGQSGWGEPRPAPQAWTPGGWALPDAPASTHLLLCWPLMVGPPTAAHPRSAWPPAGLTTSCVWLPPPDTPTQHPAAAEDGAAGGGTHGALTPSTLRKTWVPALRHIVSCASRSLMAPKPAC